MPKAQAYPRLIYIVPARFVAQVALRSNSTTLLKRHTPRPSDNTNSGSMGTKNDIIRLSHESTRSSYDTNINSVYALTKADGIAGVKDVHLTKNTWSADLFERAHRMSFPQLIVIFLVSYIFLCLIFSFLLEIGVLAEDECNYSYFKVWELSWLVCMIMYFDPILFFEQIYSFLILLKIRMWLTFGNNFTDLCLLMKILIYRTTFSTVGYGNTGTDNGCILFHIVTALEAFIGILYAGFCGAILFTKVISSQSEAQVHFEECICIRYSYNPESDGKEDIVDDSEGNKINCPHLIFRVINCRGNIEGCEIVNADLTGLVVFERKTNKRQNVKRVSSAYGVMKTDRGGYEESSTAYHRKFELIDLQPSEHPYFELDWVASHTLDANSPLLKPHVREMIKRNGGYWPHGRNHVFGIRNSLEKFAKLVSVCRQYYFTLLQYICVAVRAHFL